MNGIEKGSRVLARTSYDAWVPLRATSAVEQGMDFPVVWVIEEDRWIDTDADHHTDALPWPAEDVRPIEEAEEADKS